MQLPDLATLDTSAKLLLHNAAHWGGEVALREKEYGIWNSYSWADSRDRVQALGLGLLALGVERRDVVAIIGRNRPHWLWAELAAHAVGAMSLGIYEDALGKEVAYLLDYAGASLVFAEDEEQADKLLEIADALPQLRWIVYNDARGMRKYRDARLLSREQLIERGHSLDAARFDEAVARGKGEDDAVLCTTSGTTSHPKLAMLQHHAFLEHSAAYLRADPREPTDEYVSILPLPWIVEQVYVVAMSLLCRIRINFPESERTAVHDLREIGPTHLLLAPRVWEQLSADIHARMLDANPISRRIFAWGVRRGLAALDAGRRARLADWLLFGVLRDRLGFSRVKSAATGGSALGPDAFRFFLAMGIPLRQLYGQTETIGAYTLQRGGEVDFDSSGPPFDNTEIRIDRPDANGVGQIVTRHPHLFHGYFKQPEETRNTLTPDGWILTGDAGYLDAKGRLVVIDRVKDLAATAQGVRFSPQFIENKLKFSPYIGECVVLGNGRPAIVAILCIRYSMVAKWAESQSLVYTTYTTLSARPEVYDLIEREVVKVNASLPPGQQVTRFLLLYKELDADDGELTRTRKVRRTVIDERYHDLIDALHGGAGKVAVETVVTFEDGHTGKIRAEMAIRDLVLAPPVSQAAEWGMAARLEPAGRGSAGRRYDEVLLEVRGVTLRFGGVNALSDVSFDIRKGEIRSIIGPNGAGKSSMLNVINGFYRAQHGTIVHKGRTVRHMRPYQAAVAGIGRTFQNIALFRGMTTLDNLMTGRILKMRATILEQAIWFGRARREEIAHRERVERVIDFLEIQEIRNTPVGRLPYGLQKRVELGRALATEPELLLLDEPMAGMNLEEKEDMCRFVLDVNEEFGTTIALIEHDMSVVMDISDRVLVLDHGAKLADGTPDEVRTDPAVIDAYLGVRHD